MFVRLVFALVFACVFAACGDDSSSSSVSPEPAGDSSSSVIPASSGDESSSSQKNSNKDKSSSSIEKKSSSSVGGKNSSSSAVKSSSSVVLHVCDDGDTVISETTFKVFYYRCQDNEWVLDSTVNVVKPKVYPNMDSVFNPNVNYGSFTDPRDGKVYKTVQYYMELQSGNTTFIDSFTVMAQNLNYADTIIDSTTTVFDDSKVEKRCYNDDPWYCDNYFGGLYTWSEAMGLPKVCDSVGVTDDSRCNVKLGYDAKVQGVCPEGWHVMNETEWKHFALPRGIDASYTMLSRAVWKDGKNTNSSGMSLLPNGIEKPSNGLATFWLPEEETDDGLGVIIVNISSSLIISPTYKRGALPVRCVMDEGDTFVK